MKMFSLTIETVLITICSITCLNSSTIVEVQSIYKPTIKDLEEIQNHFLWNYIKEERVKTSYQKFVSKPYDFYVEETIRTQIESRINRSYWRGIQFIINRTYRYTLLLAIFAYESLNYGVEQSYLLEGIEKAARKLYKAVEHLRFDRMEDLRAEIIDLTTLGGNFKNALNTVTSTMNRYILYFITTFDLEKIKMFKHFSLYLKSKPIILPLQVRARLLSGFPTHRGYHKYDFHVPPVGVIEAVAKLMNIIQLINSEYLVE
ncbi:uncharacterized protein LOC126909153 [Daktulosphaira vitifoliae]|uniref:uncharacterized protein LOC126909153 n=1 Tax=Daktulosphaira vitifoliae TaxID=58002 RepID=UPI0021AAEAA4|nr:uncharacterized protein LOC126909153 [Daktulosphaira vitifoliae]